jgi:putative salt-induced outer membrane protein YdiY
MKEFALAMLVLCAAPAVSRAQEKPVSAAEADEAVVARLRALGPMTPAQAREDLKTRSASGDDAAHDLLDAVDQPGPKREALLARLKPRDPDGALAIDFNRVASVHETARARARALAMFTGPGFHGIPQPKDGEGGWENTTEVFGGSSRAGDLRTPVMGVSHVTEYTRGPWAASLEARGQVTPEGEARPGSQQITLGVARRIGDTPFSIYGEAEHRGDDYLGLRHDDTLQVGLQRAVALEIGRNSIELRAAAAAVKELSGDGAVHGIARLAAEYSFKATEKLSFVLGGEFEINPQQPVDHEFQGVAAAVYQISKSVAVRLAQTYEKRGEAIDGFAQTHSQTTLGIVIHY